MTKARLLHCWTACQATCAEVPGECPSLTRSTDIGIEDEPCPRAPPCCRSADRACLSAKDVERLDPQDAPNAETSSCPLAPIALSALALLELWSAEQAGVAEILDWKWGDGLRVQAT